MIVLDISDEPYLGVRGAASPTYDKYRNEFQQNSKLTFQLNTVTNLHNFSIIGNYINFVSKLLL